MNNPSSRGIRAFLLVAECGSFTAAAEVSGFSKANLSQLVTQLEAALGVQLLYRTTRSLRLTEVGEGYYQRCKQALRQLDAASEWASQSTDELRGRIRMNAVGGLIGEALISPLVMQFQQRHPEVRVQLDFSSVKVDLIEDQYELVVRMGALPDSTLVARTLGVMTTRYVASPDFLARHGSIHEPEDLKSLSLIYGSVDHWLFRCGQEQRVVNVNPDISLKMVSGRVMRQAALAGLGVTRLADVYCQADIEYGDLVEVLPSWSETTPISLVCPPIRHQLSRVRALMDWLCNGFEPCYQQALAQSPGVSTQSLPLS